MIASSWYILPRCTMTGKEYVRASIVQLCFRFGGSQEFSCTFRNDHGIHPCSTRDSFQSRKISLLASRYNRTRYICQTQLQVTIVTDNCTISRITVPRFIIFWLHLPPFSHTDSKSTRDDGFLYFIFSLRRTVAMFHSESYEILMLTITKNF